jgi:hypothetical protein
MHAARPFGIRYGADVAPARINHGSVHARDPRRAAEDLAALTAGVARPFHPCEGAWVCFLSGDENDWDGQLIEFYPRDVVLAKEHGKLVFEKAAAAAPFGGTHFNLTIPATRRWLEATCEERGLACAWREWQGLLEVWLESDLLVECVPDT